ncbi:MAG: hypothetical protein EXX96DRAFT_568652 [Benjaminiella poitrasii]|nr:MAG: hypothetical protein EXX96DRAFT_568652 [Benjaminiella poitrasii]
MALTSSSEDNNKSNKGNSKEAYKVSATVCSNCGTTTTPLWRRGPNGETICNACGLYLKARNTLRPPTMKRKAKNKQAQQQAQQQQTSTAAVLDNPPAGSCPGGGQCNGTGGSASCEGCPAFNQHQVNRHALICANCRTTTTPLWRRDEMGNTICNACGLYYKLHNVHRPVSMKRSMIKRRKRIIVTDRDGRLLDDEEEEQDELESTSSSSSSYDDDDDEEKVKQQIEKKLMKRREKRERKRRRKEKERVRAERQQRSTIEGSAVEEQEKPRHASLPVTERSTSPLAMTVTSLHAVPPIEDYIVPKRMTLEEQRSRQQDPSLPTTSSSHHRLPPPPTTPPLNPTLVANNNNKHIGTSLPSLQTLRPPMSHSNTTPATTTTTTTRFDPLLDYRRLSPLKEINLPPISQNLSTVNPYQDLHDFDEAMTRLERLRRRVPPEQSRVLSRLTDALENIVQQAEHILATTQYSSHGHVTSTTTPTTSYMHHNIHQREPRL